MKLSAKISISLFIAFLLPVLIIGIFSFNSILNFTHMSYRNILQDKVAGEANAVNALISSIKEDLGVTTQYSLFKLLLSSSSKGITDEYTDNQKETVKFLINKIAADSTLKEALLVDNRGVIAACTHSNFINTDITQMYNGLGSFGTWEDFKIQSYTDKYNNKFLLAYMKIFDENINCIGAIVEEYSISALEDLIYVSKFGNTGSLLIIDENGTIVLPRKANESVAPTFYRSLPTVSLVIKKMRLGELKVQSDKIDYLFDNKIVNGFYTYIPETNWLILASIDKNEVELKAKETIALVIIMALLYLLTTPIIIRFISRFFTNPINKIAESLENVKNGNFDIKCEYEKNDEFGVLAQSFNTMAAELNKTTTELLYNQQKYKLVLEDINDVIWEWNLSTNEFKIYGKWDKIFGYDLSKTKSGNLFAQSIHPDDKQTFVNEFNLYVTGKKDYFNVEYRTQNADGEYIWVACKGTAIKNSNGRSSIIMGTISDINDKKQSELQVQQLAYRDELTGVYSRQAIKHSIIELLQSKPKNYMSMIMVDVDYFKSVNDTYGHTFGDEVLKFVGGALQDCVRDNDLVGRIGGDEFIVFISRADDISAVDNVCKRIMNSVCKEITVENTVYNLSCSVGASIYPYHGDSYLSLFNHADKAMYYSKRSGRGRYHILEKDETFDDEAVYDELEI